MECNFLGIRTARGISCKCTWLACIAIVKFIWSVKLVWMVSQSWSTAIIYSWLWLMVFVRMKIALSIVYIDLSKTCFGYYHIFKSPNEKLVLTWLKQKAENHQNHTALGLQLLPHHHNLWFGEVIPNAYQFVNDLSKCSHFTLFSDIFEMFYFIRPYNALRCYYRVIWLIIHHVRWLWHIKLYVRLFIFLLEVKLPSWVLYKLLKTLIAWVLYSRVVVVHHFNLLNLWYVCI